jgi:hypothetical protein
MTSLAAHTCRVLHIVMRVFEKHLGAPFPFPQLHVVFLPHKALAARRPPMTVGTNTLFVSAVDACVCGHQRPLCKCSGRLRVWAPTPSL